MKRTIIICISLLLLTGCGGDNIMRKVNGKIVFGSSRPHDKGYPAHILKNGKISLLGNRIYGPVLSPDGELIACVVEKINNDKYDSDGIILVDDRGNEKEFIRLDKTVVSLSWFPSGDRLACKKFPGKKPEDPILCILNLKTKKIDEVLQLPGRTNILSVEVSPDGRQILFYNEGHVYLVDANGENKKRLVKGFSPAWFPDLKHIAFLSNREDDKIDLGSGLRYVYKINVDTGEIVKIGKNPGMKDLKVSKDGKYFYYSTHYGGGEVLAISPVNKPEKRIIITEPITLVPYNKKSQDWSPDWYQGDN